MSPAAEYTRAQMILRGDIEDCKACKALEVAKGSAECKRESLDNKATIHKLDEHEASEIRAVKAC
jgi:hypothetical protein